MIPMLPTLNMETLSLKVDTLFYGDFKKSHIFFYFALLVSRKIITFLKEVYFLHLVFQGILKVIFSVKIANGSLAEPFQIIIIWHQKFRFVFTFMVAKFFQFFSFLVFLIKCWAPITIPDSMSLRMPKLYQLIQIIFFVLYVI